MDNLSPSPSLKQVGVLGLGTIGSKLAVYLASLGLEITAFCHRETDAHRQALASIASRRYKGDTGIVERLILTDKLENLQALPLIIDATHESYETKQEIYNELHSICQPGTILASTTSSLDLHKLAGYYRADSFFGFHVFNPPDKMQLIELAYDEAVSLLCRKAIEDLKALLPEKVIIELPIIQGYVTNRLLFLYLNAAYNYHLETGIDFGKIDQCMKYGTNVPMGPFLLSDYIGTDICLEILEQFYSALQRPEYKPSPLLLETVAIGKLGRKSGRGFYDYPAL
jgi:3-hydroxybutyryl-CoA dehydrogenase